MQGPCQNEGVADPVEWTYLALPDSARTSVDYAIKLVTSEHLRVPAMMRTVCMRPWLATRSDQCAMMAAFIFLGGLLTRRRPEFPHDLPDCLTTTREGNP